MSFMKGIKQWNDDMNAKGKAKGESWKASAAAMDDKTHAFKDAAKANRAEKWEEFQDSKQAFRDSMTDYQAAKADYQAKRDEAKQAKADKKAQKAAS